MSSFNPESINVPEAMLTGLGAMPEGVHFTAPPDGFDEMESLFESIGKVVCHTIPDDPLNASHLRITFQCTDTGKQDIWQCDPSRPLSDVFKRFGSHHKADPASFSFYYWLGEDADTATIDDFKEINPAKTPAWYGMKERDMIVLTRGKIVVGRYGRVHSTGHVSSKAVRESNRKLENAPDITITFVDTVTLEEMDIQISPNLKMKEVFGVYSEKRGASLNSLRFKFKASALFVTNVGKRYPFDIGLTSSNIEKIYVSPVTDVFSAEKPKVETKPAKKKKSKGSKKGGKGKGKGKKKPPSQSPYSALGEEEKFKQAHSKVLSAVFVEADPKFKKIRQKLHSMNLERTKPKSKTSRSKDIVEQSYDYSMPVGLTEKAVKSSFAIQVGEVANLYKSTKTKVRLSERQRITLDIRGFTKDDALAKLDECLPGWIDEAMMGSYPFVIPVMIICGTGNQILSETVEDWIGKSDKVGNAPKNLVF